MRNLAEIACDYCKNQDFKADILPGCANFVSHCLKDGGYAYGIINYVPRLVEILKANNWNNVSLSKAPRGSIVIFKETYDAVPPAGIGVEDDMTHVGILGAGEAFYDFGGHPAHVRCGSLAEGGDWRSLIQMILAPPASVVGGHGTGAVNTAGESAYEKEIEASKKHVMNAGLIKNNHDSNDMVKWSEFEIVMSRLLDRIEKLENKLAGRN